jgi:hypothetical protein
MGCSNMSEALLGAVQQVAPQLECCYDGEVVNFDKKGPGLISADQALVSLNKCKMPKAIGNLACDPWQQKKMIRLLSRVQAAQLYTEQDDLSRATRLMLSVVKQVNNIMSSRRLAKKIATGGSCNSVGVVIGTELSSIRNLAAGISGHLNQYRGQ